MTLKGLGYFHTSLRDGLEKLGYFSKHPFGTRLIPNVVPNLERLGYSRVIPPG
jgi:hypothetical protein